MLSVIHPTSNLGSFPSTPYFPSVEPVGSSQTLAEGQLYSNNNNSYYDKKWAFTHGSHNPSSSSWGHSYLYGSDFYREALENTRIASLAHSSNNFSPCYSGSRVISRTSKDYSKPLFVDCSIEYELPNAPKVPKNSEPILMIHPAYRATKRAKRTLSKTPCVGAYHKVSKVPLNSTPNTTTTTTTTSNTRETLLNAFSRESKRSYSQMSNQHMSNADSYIHQAYYPFPRHSYECCYPPYDQSAVKRHCHSVPHEDLAAYRQQQQQNLMHLQTQFSLYFRQREAFWT